MIQQLVCYSCKATFEWDLNAHPVGRHDDCPKCHAAMRVCYNCVHFDLSAQWECREHITERVSQKDKANFCDEFRFKTQVDTNKVATPNKEDLLKNAEALFKKLK